MMLAALSTPEPGFAPYLPMSVSTLEEPSRMRVAISWDGKGGRDDLIETIRRIVGKYPNAVFLVPESFNGFASGSVIAACVDTGACVVQYMLNRAKLGEQAYMIACRRAVIEGDAGAVVVIGNDPDLEEALRDWPGAKLWKLTLPQPETTKETA